MSAIVLAWFLWEGQLEIGKCHAAVLPTDGTSRRQCHMPSTGSLEGAELCGNHMRVLREYLEPPAGAPDPPVRQLTMWEEEP